MTKPADEIHTAAYGFRVLGIRAGAGLAVHGAGDWPSIELERGPGPYAGSRVATVDAEAASFSVPDGWLTLDRARGTVLLQAKRELEDSEIVHPCLWPAAAVFARWRGHETLHAGAFLTPDAQGAWVVMGASGGGKSSLLASLATAGYPVMADDMVVIDGRDLFAGPRSIDLKPDSVAPLALQELTIDVRLTSRRRLALGPCPGRMPVRGFVELGWGDEVRVQQLSPNASFAALTYHRRVGELGVDYEGLLGLSGLPAFRLSRPRSWAALAHAQSLLIEALVA